MLSAVRCKLEREGGAGARWSAKGGGSRLPGPGWQISLSPFYLSFGGAFHFNDIVVDSVAHYVISSLRK